MAIAPPGEAYAKAHSISKRCSLFTWLDTCGTRSAAAYDMIFRRMISPMSSRVDRCYITSSHSEAIERIISCRRPQYSLSVKCTYRR